MLQDLLFLLVCILNFVIFPFAGLLGLLAIAGIFFRPRRSKVATTNGNYHFAILIPAHNEIEVIATTVESALAVDWPKNLFDVVVIADNCTDDTAGVARKHGAVVIERKDDIRRSKGFALEDVLKTLVSAPDWRHISAIMVVDADSSLDRDILKVYASEFSKGVEFLQSNNTVRNRDESWRTELMTYAFSLYNGSFQAGLDALGLGAHLRGNGMAFTREGNLSCPWQASSLAEDLEFSWRLRMADKYVGFVSKSSVRAEMPTQEKTSERQRRRWESGRKLLRKNVSRSVLEAKQSLVTRLLWLMDLWLMPLSVLSIWLAVVGVLAIGMTVMALPLPGFFWVVFGISVCSIAVYLVSPFIVMKLPLRYLKSIFFAPYYAFWRAMAIYGKGPTSWIRTTRENPAQKNGE